MMLLWLKKSCVNLWRCTSRVV